MKTFKKLLFLLSSHERNQAVLLLIMIIFMAFLDMIGIASILPFVAVLTNPGLIETNIILYELFQISKNFGIKNNHHFLFVLGFLVFALLIISLSFKALTTYAQIRFVQMREFSIGKRLIEGYLNQPYSWFLNQHSSDLGKTILSEVEQLVDNGIRPMLELFAKGFVAISLILLIIFIDLKLALLVGISLSSIYGAMFFFIRKNLFYLGEKRFKNNKVRFEIIGEAFGASKEIKVGGLEKNYIDNFSIAAKNFAQTQSSSQILSELPRYILEAVAFGGMLLIILYIMSQTGSFNTVIPIVSLYVFAGYRLMPALQQIYVAFTQLSFISPSIDKLYDDLRALKFKNENFVYTNLTLDNSIELKNIYYSYPHAEKFTLNDINISIPAKSSVGFVGTTGSGKTTIIDIILGLLYPQKGTIEIDGVAIHEKNIRSWQRLVGYVPQSIYLSDDTLAANIAFGIESKNIDYDLVEMASKIANLHSFIIDELPLKYKTTIGERGVRLSGGQRQRIGIARALYHKPQLLILDEATSALDHETEKAVIDAVYNLNKNITVILIAHRLNTVKDCDIIYKLEKGRIIKQGKYIDIV